MSPIDVVIPTYNGRDMVLECLDRLRQAGSIASIIVVDDASTDGTVEALAADFPSVRTIRLAEHRGLAHALNRGTAAGASEYVLFLNNDVLSDPAAPARLATALEHDRIAVSAGGQLVDVGTARVQARYLPRQVPGLAGLLARLTGIERLWPANPWTGRHLTAPLKGPGPLRTGRQPAGACLMVRRSALEAVGGWDERYWVWYEDVDLSRRLAAIGPAVYVPEARFEHLGGASTRTWGRHEQHLRLYHGTMLYAQTHLPRLQQPIIGLAMLGACLIRVAAYSLRRDGAAARSYRHLASAALGMCALRPVPPWQTAAAIGEGRR